MKVSDLYVGKKLEVGSKRAELFGRGRSQIRQSAYLDGPCLVGDPENFPNVQGTLMVGPMTNWDSSIPFVDCEGKFEFEPTWECDGLIGSFKGPELYDGYVFVIKAPEESEHRTADLQCVPGGMTAGYPQSCGAISTATVYDYDPKLDAMVEELVEIPLICTPVLSAAFIEGDVDIQGHLRVHDPKTDFSLTIEGEASFSRSVVVKKDVVAKGEVISQCGSHILSQKKNFDISHPTKEGWRLTHTCVEGPEAAVYIRGRVRNKNEIILPDYWKGLVDIDTITVNLTAIGSHQDLIVKRWDDEKVYLQSKGGMPIDCFYYIMAERKDTEKLIPEYEGTIEDYPGDNSQRSIAGYHYDVKR